jgi:hypothetical protein
MEGSTKCGGRRPGTALGDGERSRRGKVGRI